MLVIGYGAKICWVAMRVKAENRMVTIESDVLLLFYCLWNTTEAIPVILDVVSEALFTDYIEKIEEIKKQLEKMKKNPYEEKCRKIM